MTVDSITPDFLKTLKIPLKSGREITEQDTLTDRCVRSERDAGSLHILVRIRPQLESRQTSFISVPSFRRRSLV